MTPRRKRCARTSCAGAALVLLLVAARRPLQGFCTNTNTSDYQCSSPAEEAHDEEADGAAHRGAEGTGGARGAAAVQALRRGRRGRMEDRAVVVPDLLEMINISSDHLPASMSFYAVFDGHEGQAASQRAADTLHRAFALSLAKALAQSEPKSFSLWRWWPPSWGGATVPSTTRREPLDESVRMALREAFRQVDSDILAIAEAEDLADGSTAVVAVLWEEKEEAEEEEKRSPRMVVAHAGDSKALLCVPQAKQELSERVLLEAYELTRDHSLASGEERARVEAAGGRAVSDGRILRLNGELAVTRSLGDLPYRKFGLIGEPEVADVSPEMVDNKPLVLLILASDGIFETLNPQEACAVAGAVAYPAECPPFAWASQPSEAIALGPGPTGSQDSNQLEGNDSGGASAAESGAAPVPAIHYDSWMEQEEPSMSARRTGRHHWGLLGCHDCGPGTVLASSSPDVSSSQGKGSSSSRASPMTSAAAAVLREAFNRRSTDNLAAVVVPMTKRSGDHHSEPVVVHDRLENCERAGATVGSAEVSSLGSEAVAPRVVASPASRHQYHLQRLLTLVPTREARTSVVRHVSWEGEAVPTGAPRQGTCEGFNCLVLRDLHDNGLAVVAQQHDDDESDMMTCAVAPGQLMELPEAAGTLLAQLTTLPMDGAEGDSSTSDDRRPPLPASEGTDERTPLMPLRPAGQSDISWSGLADDDDAANTGGENADGHAHLLGWVHAEYAEYKLQGAFAQGAFGEVWRCTRHANKVIPPSGQSRSSQQTAGIVDDEGAAYVLKRLMVEKGSYTRLSGERERYFGELLSREAAAASGSTSSTGGAVVGDNNADEEEAEGLSAGDDYDLWDEGRRHIVRYVESFETNQGRELWLVFRDEGKSLHDLMYEVARHHGADGDGADDAPRLQILQPSSWWREMRRSPMGDQLLLDTVRQVLLALAALHHSNITHRDVKPANLMMISLTDGEGLTRPHVRLIDFGSAVDTTTTFRYYGKHGPSELEQTAEYAPPETTFGRFWTGKPAATKTWPYDIWSAGVVWLELLLGTPNVFQISSRTRATMDHKLSLRRNRTHEERQQLYLLRGLMELCVYPPRPSPSLPTQHQSQPLPPVPWSCSDRAVLELLRTRDPTGRGPPSILAVRLLRSLLDWRPSSRPTALEALRHAAFSVGQSQAASADDAELADCSRRTRREAGWC